jgi:hypothetical protein
MGFIQAKGSEQEALGNGQAFDGRFACNHEGILGWRGILGSRKYIPGL